LIVAGLAAGFVVWIVLPPLDVRRFRWTPGLPLWIEAAGGVLLLASGIFLFRSFTDNTYLSPLVRIQTERRQQVVSTGVYGIVRHPMYLGASLKFLGGPLLLGSAWGLLAGAALVLLLVLRIGGEERLLASQLEGYEAYRERVRYRLVPRVW
jgi:protein-S-isoprenylcysteine O-methyltransferase Ste14